MANGESWSVNQCVNCANMDISSRNPYDSSEACCGHYRKYYKPTDNACCAEHFIYDATRYDATRENPSSNCYLTTITCEILGDEDNCSTLETLRIFREEVLKKNAEYHDLLCEYDIVGPLIAHAIRNSLDPQTISRFLMDTYIEPTKNCILEGKIELAISIYKYMVEELKKLCGIPKMTYAKDIEPTGKGYIKGLGFQHRR